MFKTDDERTRVAAMAAQVAVSRYGGDCYAYGLLATGYVDLVTEASLKIYDFMALVPVVEGAGGIMTDWSGAPLDRHSDGHVLAAANETCHREAMAYLKDA
jgi:fructose-1,6-bisphosphatase/inositol monophosphatase family enzyme